MTNEELDEDEIEQLKKLLTERNQITVWVAIIGAVATVISAVGTAIASIIVAIGTSK